MRTIKFRAWDKVDKKMFYPKGFDETMVIQLSGVLGQFNGKTYDTVTDYFILMQFTGLKDKNGKEIYEGDLIKLESFIDEKDFIVPVVFKDGIFEAKGSGLLVHAISMNNGVVVGNIYEHKNLLNDTKYKDCVYLNNEGFCWAIKAKCNPDNKYCDYRTENKNLLNKTK
jgi:uncharacterized phage protein (TIGR01671 family)